jgi:hypothetical protein
MKNILGKLKKYHEIDGEGTIEDIFAKISLLIERLS